MAKKKATTTRTAARLTPLPTADQAKAAAAKVTEDLGMTKQGTPRKSKQGRKQADHGLKRTSILADAEQMKRLKVAAAQQGRHMYELLSEAIDMYLAE